MPLPPTNAPALALASLAREHGGLLHALARRLCRDAVEAGDLVQDTYERALRSAPQLQPGTNARAWLVRILYNRFLDGVRAGARAPLAAVRAEDVAERVAAPAPEPLSAWERVTPEQLEAAVERLPEEFRTVFRLHTLEGRSYAEIAAALGVPKNTVGTRLIRARRRLKALLTGEGGDAGSEAP